MYDLLVDETIEENTLPFNASAYQGEINSV